MLQHNPKNRPGVSDIIKANFFIAGYMPKKLPPSCLTMAPRFDSINYRESISHRKPLIGNQFVVKCVIINHIVCNMLVILC